MVEDDNKMVQKPEDISLRLISICNSDKQHEKRSNEYQDYLISWKYYPSLIANKFKKCPKFIVIKDKNFVAKFEEHIL